MCCSRAQRSAPTLPSIPRTPNPPGTQIASTPLSDRRAPSGVAHSSEATQRSRILASLWKPPARNASVTER
jgi:hypothetical protein